MKKIFDFELFLESIVAGKSVYYYSERFRKVIYNIASEKDPIAMFIKHVENWTTFQDDITFIDLGETEDKVSFIQVNRLDRFRQTDRHFNMGSTYYSSTNFTIKPIEDLSKYIEKVWKLTQSNLSHDGWSQQRTQIGVGRFVNRVAALQKITLKSEQLEKFVNSYKAHCKKIIGKERFEIVEGEDIKKYYSVDSYQERKGQLFASCMRYDACQTYFNIYIKNPEVCKMLILKGEEEEKIAGRALIWTTTSGETYMDRQYTNYDSDILLFKNYAKSNGWLYYGSGKGKDLEVQLKDIDYVKYPYMDTFKYYDVKKQLLSSSDALEEEDHIWTLEKTDGTYRTSKIVYSEVYDEDINAEDAVWAVDEDGWIRRTDAIWIESAQAWYAEWNEEDICYSNFEGLYILAEDSVYSDTLMDNLTIDKSVEVWINSKRQDWFPESVADEVAELFEIDGEELYCLKKSVTKDEEGNWKFIK
jgi:hypothetical protein